MADNRRLSIAIVEDDLDVREGLAILLGSMDGVDQVAKYRSMEEALPGIARQLPDVVLADLQLPGMSGAQGIQLLRERHPALPALVLTNHADDDRIFAALCAGACGYLLKGAPAQQLLVAVKEVLQGGAPMTPAVARKVVDLFRRAAPPSRAESQLTPHELRVLKLVVEGHGYREIASQMGVTVHTISFHLRRVYEKLEVHSKSAAVAKALKLGLL